MLRILINLRGFQFRKQLHELVLCIKECSMLQHEMLAMRHTEHKAKQLEELIIKREYLKEQFKIAKEKDHDLAG